MKYSITYKSKTVANRMGKYPFAAVLFHSGKFILRMFIVITKYIFYYYEHLVPVF